MRVLHTSDWHLGRSFHGASLLDEQVEAMDRIVTLVAEESIDLVLIAGDLYDRAIPPTAAVRLFNDTLLRLHRAGATVAAISGNHDSAVRVGGQDELLNELGIAVRGDAGRVDEPLVIAEPADGGPPVLVYLVPYLEPLAVAGELLVESEPVVVENTEAGPGEPDVSVPDAPTLFEAASQPVTRRGRPTQDVVTNAAVERIRRHLAGYVSEVGPVRSVVVAHTFVAGGAVSESERDLSVGNVERVSADTFDGFDLVALGHLHAPQSVRGDRIAYSGTPLPYSFSEEHHTKSVRIVDLAVDGTITARAVPLGVGRPVRTLVGELEALLADPELADAVEARVRVLLTDAHLPNEAMARMRSRFPHVMELRHEPAGVQPDHSQSIVGAGDLQSMEPVDLTLRFWREQHGAEATEAERDLLVAALSAGVAHGGDA
ncbi:MAG: exonuclease SbcCD subunit D [Aquihabitans sp.]